MIDPTGLSPYGISSLERIVTLDGLYVWRGEKPTQWENACYGRGMNVALRKPMSRAEFFSWAEAQEVRYEFDGLQPVGMTGGNINHARLTRNINRELANRLAGKACESLGPDAGVATIADAVRYPDAVVTCTRSNGRERVVANPVIVFEVISPTSARIDRVVKLEEYQAVPSIRCYAIVEQDAAVVTVYRRNHDQGPFRTPPLQEGEILHLPEIGIEIPIAAIYDGIGFDEATMTRSPP